MNNKNIVKKIGKSRVEENWEKSTQKKLIEVIKKILGVIWSKRR